MHVYYRITSIPSRNPSPIYQEDKNKLNELCLRSFLLAFKSIQPKITFLADFCTCTDMIKRVCEGVDYEIIESEVGQNQTMLDSYRLASEVDDYVWFQECDYLYAGSGEVLLQALKRFPLVSPYDHPNFYKDRELHSPNCQIYLVGERHFRSVERNTMTWGCHSSLVKENRDILDAEGYLDGPVWYKLKERGHELYVPIPSLATHMCTDWLASGTDWEEVWTSLSIQI